MELLNKRPLFTAILAFLISAVISVSILHKKILFFVFIGILIIFLAITILFGCLKKLNISKSLIRTIILVVVFSLISSLYQYAYSSTRFEGDSGKPIENASIIATIEEISYSKNNSTFFIAKTESVNDDKVNEKFKFEYFGKEELSVGDVLECEGTVTPLYSYKITSGDSYDAAKGASAIVSEVHDLKVTKETNSIYKSLSIISSYIQSKISSACESDGGDFIVSLILGNKYALDSNIRADFKVLGISHILAISGMHISILMFGIQYILSTFNFKKWLRIVITIAFTFLYVGISGFAASALRAAFMLCVVSLAKLSRRDNDSYTSLALAIGTIIILQPYSVYDLGLWLSFLATLGILVALPFIKEKSQTRHAKIINAILN